MTWRLLGRCAGIFAVFLLATTTFSVIAADEVTLHLPNYIEPQTNKTAEVVARHILDHSGRPPLEMLGERYDAILAQADIVIAIRITNVVLCAVTMLDEWFDLNTTPIFWYTVYGELLDTVRGTFEGTAIKFQTSCGMHRNTWPYVTSFAYQLGLEKREGIFHIVAQVRTCPFPPYRLVDHKSYAQLRRTGALSADDQGFWSELIYAAQPPGVKCLDASLELGKYMIVTHSYEPILGGLDWDYGRGVFASVYSFESKKKLDVDDLLPFLGKKGVERLGSWRR